jgi:hypothetical protein
MGILDDAIREHLELKRQRGATEEEVRLKEAEAFGPVRNDVGAAPALAADETALLQPADVEGQAPEGVYPDHPVEAPAGFDPDPGLAAHAPEPESVAAEPVPPVAAEPIPPVAAEPVPPVAAEPEDHPIPDPHDHAHSEGKDPAWADDTELFAAPSPPPAPPQHREERHPIWDTDEHLREHDAPEPVFGHRSAAPAAPVEEPPVTEPPLEEPPVHEPPVDDPPVRSPDDAAAEDVLEDTPEFLQDAPEHDRLWFEQKPPRDFDFGEK